MNQESLKEDLKFYTVKSIVLATFFGGPLAAAVLIRRNFLNVNENGKALASIFIGIISTILLFVLILSLPEEFWEVVPNFAVPAIYSSLLYPITERFQGQVLKEHEEKNGSFFSAWRAAGIGFFFSIVIILGIIGYVFATDTEYEEFTHLYENKIEQFLHNEAEAKAIFLKIVSLNDEEIIEEFRNGKILWVENHQIIQDLLVIDNLPTTSIHYLEKLQEYSGLQVDFFDLFIKTRVEQTDIYGPEMEQILDKINQIFSELN